MNSELEQTKPLQAQLLEIDGSTGEGGGRIFRDTVSYAMRKALNEAHPWRGKVIVTKIRASRPKGGGMKNSLFGILDFAKQVFSGLVITGDTEGSPTVSIDFEHAELRSQPQDTPHVFTVDANGSGSAWLLFLAVHPVLCSLPYASTCNIKGGTDVFMKRDKKNPRTLTPPSIYMQQVWAENMNRLCADKTDPSGYNSNIVWRTHCLVSPVVSHSDLVRLAKTDTPAICVSVNQADHDTHPVIIEINLAPKQRHASIKTVESTVVSPLYYRPEHHLPFILGASHPYPDYDNEAPDPKETCDEHFADMVTPYTSIFHEPVLSPHHESAVYVKKIMGFAHDGR